MRKACALVVVAFIALCTVGCTDRSMIPDRSRAMAYADMELERCGLDWGPVVWVWEPAPWHSEGPACWQVDYQSSPAGLVRVVLVDAQTGWAFLPPMDWQPRLRRPVAKASTGTLPDGAWIVVLTDDRSGRDLVAEAERLNRLAARSWPRAFSVRPCPQRQQLIYGWHDGTGTRRNDDLLHWIHRRSGYPTAEWVDLRR